LSNADDIALLVQQIDAAEQVAHDVEHKLDKVLEDLDRLMEGVDQSLGLSSHPQEEGDDEELQAQAADETQLEDERTVDIETIPVEEEPEEEPEVMPEDEGPEVMPEDEGPEEGPE